jgi:hypothetical protein
MAEQATAALETTIITHNTHRPRQGCAALHYTNHVPLCVAEQSSVFTCIAKQH